MNILEFTTAAALIVAVAAASLATIIPSDTGSSASLNGIWRFKLEQAGDTAADAPRKLGAAEAIATPASFEPFQKPEYVEDSSWHDLSVPGNWEIAGYSPATYDHPDNASGFYRKWFVVPAAWQGRNVLVNFDGVQNGAEVFVNGEPVRVNEPSWGRANYHESGWTAWQADLTPHVKYGAKNLLAIRITKNTRSADLDSGDYFFLGGIHRAVTLFAVPEAHVQDVTVRTSLLPGGKAQILVSVAVSRARQAPAVAIRVGKGAWRTKPAGTSGIVEFRTVLSKPRLWSAETPNLYPLAIELRSASGKATETISRRIGVREVSIKAGVLQVNGVPVKLAGICRHEVYPSEGTAVGPDVWRKDLELMKAANINAIRTSHYPYGSGFYDLCDEMGFYVIDELPYCWCPTDDPATTPAFKQRAQETVRRDNNHACVIIWAVGNENKPGRNLQVAANIVKAMDPTRPRLVSRMQADRYGVELDDRHYTSPAETRKLLADKKRRAKWPLIFTENPNVWDVRNGADYGCLDLWAAVLKRNWDVAWASPHIPGEFLWEWQDRAVQDQSPVKLYRFDPETGIQYVKTKGIVDGWRNPRPDYYHVKMVYSPVQVEPKADLTSKPGAAVLATYNRYSFLNLSELRTTWTLLSVGKSLKSGPAYPEIAPRKRGKIAIPLPKGWQSLGADTLRVSFDDPRGWNVVTYQFRVSAEKPYPPLGPLPPGTPFPTLNLIVRHTHKDPYLWSAADRRTARLANLVMRGTDTSPGIDGSLDADIDLDGVVSGHVKAQFTNGTFAYSLYWSGAKMDVQEVGWTFLTPPSFDHFSWKREALWSYYPDTHIGRPSGTATPDSMDVHNTNITRPDAFDFNSTKYDCHWASLTGADGHGLRIEFAAGQRHHVRAAKDPAGGMQLIVNRQVSPPRDLSSNAVPDLYLELNPGSHVEGSFRVGSE